MTDASFRSAGDALMIEENQDQKIQSKRKTLVPVAFGSKVFSPTQLKTLILPNAILALYMSFIEFTPVVGETTITKMVITGNTLITPFFKTKAVPKEFWNACDDVLQFNIKVAHIAYSVNTSADFLSILELKDTEKFRLEIREDIETTPVEVTSFSEVTDKEQLFLTQADNENESKEQTLLKKPANCKEWVKKGTILTENSKKHKGWRNTTS